MDKRKQNDMDNLTAKANSCRADLRFLLGIIPEAWSVAKRRVEVAIATLKNPTEQKITAALQLAAIIHEQIRQHEMDENLVTTHELLRVERSTPTTAAPVTVEFDFLIGYDCYARIKAEVITETDADGFSQSSDVTITSCFIGENDVSAYSDMFGEETRKAIKQEAIQHSKIKKYHSK
jgi:hypothetical protein